MKKLLVLGAMLSGVAACKGGSSGDAMKTAREQAATYCECAKKAPAGASSSVCDKEGETFQATYKSAGDTTSADAKKVWADYYACYQSIGKTN